MIVLLAPAAFRTTLNPIQWTLSTDAAAVAPGKTVLLRLHAEVAPGFHMHSLTTPAGGPIPTVIQLAPNPGGPQFGCVSAQTGAPKRSDIQRADRALLGKDGFSDRRYIAGCHCGLSQNITGKARYQACSDRICLPPAEHSAETGIAVRVAALVPPPKIPMATSLGPRPSPVTAPEPSTGKPSLNPHFLVQASALQAFLTPCVFPECRSPSPTS